MTLLAKPVTRVWIALMAVTVVTTWVLAEDGVPPHLAAAAIMILAAGKVVMVMAWFMELRDAPAPWQVIFGGWALIVTGIVLGFYFAA